MKKNSPMRPAIALAEAVESPICDVVAPMYALLDLLLRNAAADPDCVTESRIIDTKSEVGLAELIEAHGYTLNGLARESGVSRSQVSRLARGTVADPLPTTLAAIAVALGVDYDQVVQAHRVGVSQ